MTQNGDESEDLRIRRTRRALQVALIELTVEQGFSAITVRDLTERAMVNRSTFYRHYLDKYDLLEKYLDEVAEFTAQDIELGHGSGQAAPGLIQMLKHLQSYADFYRVMFGPKGDPMVAQRFRRNTESRFRDLFATFPSQPDPGGPPPELRIQYAAYAGSGAIVWWLENGLPCSAEQLAQWLNRLTSASTGLIFDAGNSGAKVDDRA